MEIALCVFLGAWISVAGICGYFWIKREMKPYLEKDIEKVDKAK